MTVADSSKFLAALNREQHRLTLLAWPYILGFVVAASVPDIYLDWYYYDLDSLRFPVAFLVWALGYLLTLLLLQRGELLPTGERGGIGTFFAVGLISGMAIGLALIVFVLPGLYLVMRWLPAYGRALTTHDWVGNSLRWSWDATEPFQKALSIALIGPAIFYATLSAAFLPSAWMDAIPYEVWSVILNLAASIGSAWLTILGVASFATISAWDSEG